jgi:signal transduction histidine kinase
VKGLFADDFGASEGGLNLAVSSGQRVGPVGTSLRAATGVKAVVAGVTPLTDASGSVTGYVVTLDDATTRPEDLQLNADVLASVSHELRGPLANIKVYSELILGGLADDQAELREHLSVISREADRLEQLVTEFLDLSRLESGRLRPKKTELSLGEVLDRVVSALRFQAAAAQVTITTDIPTDLAPYVADETLIGMAIRNLVANAVKFSRANGTVHVRVTEDADWFSLTVKDQGVGIPESAIPKLFSRFFQVPAEHNGTLRGTGLGLALTKQAISVHGGSIEVQSTLGQGSVFTVTLPKVPPSSA